MLASTAECVRICNCRRVDLYERMIPQELFFGINQGGVQVRGM